MLADADYAANDGTNSQQNDAKALPRGPWIASDRYLKKISRRNTLDSWLVIISVEMVRLTDGQFAQLTWHFPDISGHGVAWQPITQLFNDSLAFVDRYLKVSGTLHSIQLV